MLSVNIECDCDELPNCDVKAGDNSFKIADIKKCVYCGCYFARIDFPQTFNRQLTCSCINCKGMRRKELFKRKRSKIENGTNLRRQTGQMINKSEGLNKWQRGLASIQLDKFKENLTKNKVNKLLEELSSNKINIIDFIEPNLIVFEKRNCNPEYVGKHIEGWLFDNFKLKKKIKPEYLK